MTCASRPSPDRDRPTALPAFQIEVSRAFFALPASAGFLLDGGGALAAQHLTQRPTRDLDIFTAPGAGDVGLARDAFARSSGSGQPTAGAGGGVRSTAAAAQPGQTTAGDGRPAAGWVQSENAIPGTPAWVIPNDRVATEQRLGAFADKASVVVGGSTRLFEGASSPHVLIQAFRVGDYGGAGSGLV